MAASTYVGTFTKKTGTGTQAITGVGFQPTALLFWWTNQSSNGAVNSGPRMSLGFSDGTNHRGMAHHGSDNVSPSEHSRAWRNDACLLLYNLDESDDSIGVVSALGSDGFTVNWTTAAGSSGSLIHFMAFGGEITAKVGDFLANTSTGNQSVTGVGFQPKGLFFLSAGWTTSNTSVEDFYGPPNIGFVGTDGSQASFAADSAENVTPSDTGRYQRTDKCITRIANTVSVRHEAAFVSHDDDGFTINWTAIDATQAGLGGRVPYLALAGCTARVGSLTTPTSAGEVSMDTIANPRGVLLGSVGAASSASIQTQNRFTLGGFDGTNQAVSMVGDEHNLATTRGMRYHSDAAVLAMYDTVAVDGSTSTAVVVAEGVSLGANSFTVDWTTVSATPRQVVYVAIGDGGIRGSAVFGETTTVTGSRSFAVGINGDTNLHDRPGWAIVFGNLQVTGDLEAEGSISVAGVTTLIEQKTPSGTGVVTFSSLGAYTHLHLMWAARGDQVATSTNMNLTFNGDTGSNYDRQLISANATTLVGAESLAAASAAIGSVAAASATSGLVGAGDLRIYDYRGTTFFKQAVSNEVLRTGTASGTAFARQFSIGWRSASAITSITITLASGNFVAGSKFSLYGWN